MSCYTIYYNEGAKMMRPVLTAAEYRNLRNTEKQKAMVRQVRNEGSSPQPSPVKGEGVDTDASKLKMRLLQMNYSCIPSTNDNDALRYDNDNHHAGCGPLKGCTTPSNTVGMDVDILRNENEDENEYQARLAAIPEKVLSKKDELGLLMLERSATKGYHLVFKRKVELSQEENLRWASDLLGVEFDKGAKDITRVFFTTTASEDDLLFLDDELFRPSPQPSPVKGEGVDTTANEAPSGSKGNQTPSSYTGEGREGGLFYLGIPYSDIISKYWEMFNEGREPVEGNRNVLTYELAMTLRPICDYDLEKMLQVIPNYWAKPQGDGSNHSPSFKEGDEGRSEWRKTIQNAINEPRKGMPYRLRQVLKAVKDERKMALMSGNSSLPLRDGEGGSLPERPKRMPPFLKLLSSKVPLKIKPMVEEACFPSLCAHLRNVTFRYVDGVIHEANISELTIDRQSSGKGHKNQPIEYVLADITARDMENETRLKDWRRRNQGKASSKDRQPRPEDICIQRLDDDLTPAALAQALIDADANGGKRIITKVDEVEMLNRVGNGRNDTVGLLVRYGFDTQKFGQRRVGLDSVSGSYTVRWVWNASCTQKSARKFITSDWIANGSLSRLNINSLMLSKDDHEIAKIGEYDDKYANDLRPYIDRLNAASGLIECPQANKLALEMIDEHNRIADLCESEGYRTFSYRAIVIGWLKANILYIAHGYRWDKAIAEYVRYSVRRNLYLKMYFFGKQIEEEFEIEDRQTHSGPQNMLALLPEEFSYDTYLQLRQQQGKHGDGKGTLRMWKSRGYIDYDEVTEHWVKRPSSRTLSRSFSASL